MFKLQFFLALLFTMMFMSSQVTAMVAGKEESDITYGGNIYMFVLIFKVYSLIDITIVFR